MPCIPQISLLPVLTLHLKLTQQQDSKADQGTHLVHETLSMCSLCDEETQV